MALTTSPPPGTGWTLTIETFGKDPGDDTAYGLNCRRERSIPPLAAPEQAANAFRGAIVGAMQASRHGWDDELRFMLVRLQELYAEAMARNPNAGKFTVAYARPGEEVGDGQ